MKFKIEPDSDGYFLYVENDNKWILIGFRYTLIGTKFLAWRYKKHYEKMRVFEL